MEALINALNTDRYAASSADSNRSHLKTWSLFHYEVFKDVRPIPPVIPITVHAIIGVGALFKSGGYRSYPNYASAAKSMHVDAGHYWSQLLDHTSRWVSRSVLRGIGPARQSCTFHFTRLCRLTRSTTPLVNGGPFNPVVFTILASIYMLREIEASTAVVGSWTLSDDPQELVWLLPASKSDHLALGVRRAWPCICGHAQVPCPYHLAANHISQLADAGFDTADEAPLFPTIHGKVPSKAAVVNTFEAVGTMCGQRLQTESGTRAFGGHSARVTGVQTFAALGIEINKLRLMARHSGETIMRYAAEAPLKSLRADLGLSEERSTTSLIPAASRTPKAVARRFVTLEAMIERLEGIVSQHADALAQDDPVTPAAVPKQYLQNTTTAAVHALRPQNLAQTICGWTYGVTSKRGRVRRSGNYERIPDLEGIPGPMICKNCMPRERAAAMLIPSVLAEISGDEMEPTPETGPELECTPSAGSTHSPGAST